MTIKYINVNGHIEVYGDGVFLFSADTMAEAVEEAKAVAMDDCNVLLDTA